MHPIDLTRLVFHFVRTRWGLRFRDRAALDAWQQGRIACFLKRELQRAPFYRGHAGLTLAQLPIVDKRVMLANFGQMNAAGITLEQATSVALEGEHSRDFAASLDGVTVGLSSGTQGPRGIFLAGAGERAKWAGILLARVLPAALLPRLMFGAPIGVAFFLRANSNLYTTLKSRRIDFRFYDLYDGFDAHIGRLQAQQPEVLVAPSRILGRIARLAIDGKLAISPVRVIAVAEVLEPDDRQMIEQAFGLTVHQLYQCTEGFLGYTCEKGVLHLNEEFVHIEPEWIDAGKTRFVPIVTDFNRNTQLIVRYRLGDILRVRQAPCACGRAGMALDAIEGRSDDVLWLSAAADGAPAPLYPDLVRHAVTSAPCCLPDYRIEQHGTRLRVAVADESAASFEALSGALVALMERQGIAQPEIERMAFVDTDPQHKRRRIRCVARPGQEAPCAVS